jgi:hypothetical protein
MIEDRSLSGDDSRATEFGDVEQKLRLDPPETRV